MRRRFLNSPAEALLGAEEFAALFKRKVTFAAVKNRLEEFLSSEVSVRKSHPSFVPLEYWMKRI